MNKHINIDEYIEKGQNEINKSIFNRLDIRCCRQELYEFMLLMNKNVCNKFVTFGECNSCENHDGCDYINKYTLNEIIAMANLHTPSRSGSPAERINKNEYDENRNNGK